jgi:putative hydrolase of the HAD superfamily
VIRAVVFDLWQTLALWPDERSVEHRRAWSDSLGVPPERLDEHWYSDELYRFRETGPIAVAISALYERLGVDAPVDEILGARLELTRGALTPVAGAIQTLEELRRRGVAVGLVSNCTEDVAIAWEGSPFTGHLDVTVFSATAGCMKPDSRIYELALAGLGVAASEALFVGDGANDELAGARRVGMTPVLVQPEGEAPRWEGLESWAGLRVSTIPEVLDLAPVPEP